MRNFATNYTTPQTGTKDLVTHEDFKSLCWSGPKLTLKILPPLRRGWRAARAGCAFPPAACGRDATNTPPPNGP